MAMRSLSEFFHAGDMREETCPGDPKTFDQVEKERLLGNRNDLAAWL